jgi:radical SAM superfamily enzyme YgiQ (UPF0313 family)
MNSKILLVNPWITDFAAYDYWLKPLGVLYIAAVLRRHGYEVELIDCLHRGDPELLDFQRLAQPKNRFFSTGKFHREIIPKPELYRNIPRHFARYGLPLELFQQKLRRMNAPAAVLVTSGMTYWYPGVQTAMTEIRRAFPNVPILLGGIYATLCYEHARANAGADDVIAGEGEAAALERVEAIAGVKRDRRFCPNSLDAIPFPALDLYENLGYAVIMTSRGCPLKCSFCASHLVAGAYRWRTPENVLAEIEFDYEKLGLREFAFYDDALLTNHQNHLSLILDEILRRNWNVSFHTPNGLQCKLLDHEIAELMFRSGFKSIRLSYESGNPLRLKDICKKSSDDYFERAVHHLYDAGYRRGDADAYVLAALPGQSIEEVLSSMAFVHRHGVKIRLAVFSPIPGTVEWQRAQMYFGFPEDADPLLSNNSILPIRPPGATFHTFEKLSLLAKRLNESLIVGAAPASVSSLVAEMKMSFTRFELCGATAVAV